MTSAQPRHCCHTSDDGTQCKAHPLVGGKYCFFHDPAMKKKCRAAGRNGGLMRGQRALAGLRLPPGMFTGPLQTPSDLAELLNETLARFCRGEIDLRLVSAVTRMTNSLLQAWNRASAQDDYSGLGAGSAFYSDEDESEEIPETKEALLELLQRDVAKVRRLKAELEENS